MITKTILLNSITKVKNFVNTVEPFEGHIDAVAGRYTVDAKSIMGLFSIDLADPFELQIDVENPEDFTIDLSEFEYVEPEPEG